MQWELPAFRGSECGQDWVKQNSVVIFVIGMLLTLSIGIIMTMSEVLNYIIIDCKASLQILLNLQILFAKGK
jgi:hypothetical protein